MTIPTMPATKETPQFEHDCATCHFLGRHVDPENSQPMDLYAHTQGSATVIARTGIDGDYMSGLLFSYGSVPALTEARRRAQASGHLQYDLYTALSYTTPEDPLSYAELKDAIAQSSEWHALLAFEDENTLSSQNLINSLIDKQLAENQERNPGALRLAASFDVSNRLDC